MDRSRASPVGARDEMTRAHPLVAPPTAASTAQTEDEVLVGDGLMTVAEAATFLRVSRSTLYALMDRGALVYVKIGAARRIPRRALIDVAVANLQGEASR